MIGEHELASGFNAFWGELLPLLTPACVTVVNRRFGDYLDGYRPVDIELGPRISELQSLDILAETAFEIFRVARFESIQFRQIALDEERLAAAWSVASASIALHRRVGQVLPPSPGAAAHDYLLAVGRRYAALSDLIDLEAAVFSPTVQGCGILRACEGDIATSDCLVEVKTVARNFSSKDLRQVLIYLALRYISDLPEWGEVLLFNPRRSFVVRFEPEQLVTYIAGGKSLVRVYREIEEFLVERDFVPDHGF